MTFDLHRLDNVELAKTGTWEAASGEFTMTTEHFQAAVDAQNDPELSRPRIKFGHRSVLNDILAQLGDGAPAYGYVENLRLSADGNTLIGDLAGIPEPVAGLIGRAYQQRSVEMRINASTPSGREYPAVLTGLALLGAAPPAVKGMADLVPLFAAQAEADSPVTGAEVHVTLSDAEATDAETHVDTAYTDPVSDKTTPDAVKAQGTPKTEETATMATLTPEALKSLGLDADATEADVEAAITALATKATAPATNDGENADKAETPAADRETVNASQGGVKTVTLSEGVYEDMKSQIDVLMSEKVERENAALLTDALEAGKLAAADKPSVEALLSESPEAGRKFLASLKPGRVNMSETGSAAAKPTTTTLSDEDLLALVQPHGK